MDDILIAVRAPVGPINLFLSRAYIGRGLAATRITGQYEVRTCTHQPLVTICVFYPTMQSIPLPVVGLKDFWFQYGGGYNQFLDDLVRFLFVVWPSMNESEIIQSLTKKYFDLRSIPSPKNEGV